MEGLESQRPSGRVRLHRYAQNEALTARARVPLPSCVGTACVCNLGASWDQDPACSPCLPADLQADAGSEMDTGVPRSDCTPRSQAATSMLCG